MTEITAESQDWAGGRVLVVEDDLGLGELLHAELSEQGLDVRCEPNAELGLRVIEAFRPHMIISDLRLPGMDGMELLQATRGWAGYEPAFVLITAFGSIAQAVEALKQGADDFLTKPLDLTHLQIRVKRLLKLERLRRDIERYRQLDRGAFHDIIGRSAPMRALSADIRKVAEARGTVLILGESGTGKELVAHAIHRESARCRQPFVPVNCASIPAALIESEFFGHEAGAFTGATRPRTGLFAEADGGTILLDEVGELPLDLQAKLLRVLQDGVVRRVGSNKVTKVDVRVLVATHRDLEQEVAAGRFRQDLYYRLATLVLKVPPLRDRRDDVPLLASHFLERVQRDVGRTFDGFDAEALELLGNYRYPGNVRELSNVVEHAVTFCSGSAISVRDLPERLRTGTGRGPDAPQAVRVGAPSEAQPKAVSPDWLPRGDTLPTLDEVCSAYVQHVLGRSDGNKRRAAALLGISRRTLYRHLRRLTCASR